MNGKIGQALNDKFFNHMTIPPSTASTCPVT